MTRAALLREIKKAVERLPNDRLESVADYVAFVSRPTLKERIEKAEEEFNAGKGINWRKVRDDV